MNRPRFQVRRSRLRRHRWHVVLIAANGEILSTSETLNSIDAVNNNVAAQLAAFPLVKHIDWR